ncbi:(2Fe-2S)-binding protein [Candidatus Poribacteria bacterium]|nr:(2Fe-2S)-binding protein [Candidatus Poribacteria bacterium]
MEEIINFKLNGKPVSLTGDNERMLLWVLRSQLNLTGTKYGCGSGFCGACTVIVNEEAIRSCQLPVKEVKGKEVLTIEGLAQNGNFHPLQEAFIKHNAFQCGFCTSGMILNAYSLLLKNPQPTRTEIIQSMEGNLCRCSSYFRIVQAIQTASREMKGVR